MTEIGVITTPQTDTHIGTIETPQTETQPQPGTRCHFGSAPSVHVPATGPVRPAPLCPNTPKWYARFFHVDSETPACDIPGINVCDRCAVSLAALNRRDMGPYWPACSLKCGTCGRERRLWDLIRMRS